MPAVQRNGRTIPPESKPDSSNEHIPSAMPVTQGDRRPSPYLLLVYPVLLAIGSLWAVISPAAVPPPTAPLAPGVTSDLNVHHFHQTNYFAGKHNLINIYFVKIGWFWTTVAFILLQNIIRLRASLVPKHYFQASLRYALVTLSWILTTQWCFGPALIDRSFTFTGGQCAPHQFNEASLTDSVKLSQIKAGIVCKASGGKWHGGHDISGHVFILVLSSAFLLYELDIADRHSTHPHVSPQAAAAVAHDITEEERKAVGGWETERVAKVRIWARYFLYGVVGLDLWMLMMTAIWFHTWSEKLSGLLLAGSTIWIVFFLGDFLPLWRSVIGGL